MRHSLAILIESYNRFNDDDGWAIASHIALAALTSLFQFLIFLTALAGFLGSKEVADKVTMLMFAAWPAEVAKPLANEINNVLTQSHGGLLTLGAVLGLYFSASAVEALRIALNRAYNQKDRRSWWWLRLESIVFVLIGAMAALALGFLVVLGPLIWSYGIKYAPRLHDISAQVTLARYGVAALVFASALLLAHKFLPSGQRKFRDVWPGALLSFLASFVFAEAFGTYIGEFATNYVTTYAGLASVMIALLYLYSLASIFVFGAELNATLMGRRGRSRPKFFGGQAKTVGGASAGAETRPSRPDVNAQRRTRN